MKSIKKLIALLTIFCLSVMTATACGTSKGDNSSVTESGSEVSSESTSNSEEENSSSGEEDSSSSGEEDSSSSNEEDSSSSGEEDSSSSGEEDSSSGNDTEVYYVTFTDAKQSVVHEIELTKGTVLTQEDLDAYAEEYNFEAYNEGAEQRGWWLKEVNEYGDMQYVAKMYYGISTVEEFKAMDVSSPANNYYLENDLDFSETPITTAGAVVSYIGNDLTKICYSEFDGQNYTISGLVFEGVDGVDNHSLFGSVDGSIKNLNVQAVMNGNETEGTGNGNYIKERSAVLATNLLRATIDNVHIAVKMNNVEANINGVFGAFFFQGSITNSTAYVDTHYDRADWDGLTILGAVTPGYATQYECAVGDENAPKANNVKVQVKDNVDVAGAWKFSNNLFEYTGAEVSVSNTCIFEKVPVVSVVNETLTTAGTSVTENIPDGYNAVFSYHATAWGTTYAFADVSIKGYDYVSFQIRKAATEGDESGWWELFQGSTQATANNIETWITIYLVNKDGVYYIYDNTMEESGKKAVTLPNANLSDLTVKMWGTFEITDVVGMSDPFYVETEDDNPTETPEDPTTPAIKDGYAVALENPINLTPESTKTDDVAEGTTLTNVINGAWIGGGRALADLKLVPYAEVIFYVKPTNGKWFELGTSAGLNAGATADAAWNEVRLTKEDSAWRLYFNGNWTAVAVTNLNEVYVQLGDEGVFYVSQLIAKADPNYVAPDPNAAIKTVVNEAEAVVTGDLPKGAKEAYQYTATWAAAPQYTFADVDLSEYSKVTFYIKKTDADGGAWWQLYNGGADAGVSGNTTDAWVKISIVKEDIGGGAYVYRIFHNDGWTAKTLANPNLNELSLLLNGTYLVTDLICEK